MAAHVNRALFFICICVMLIGLSLTVMAQTPSPEALPPFPPPPSPTPTQFQPVTSAAIELRVQPVYLDMWQTYFWQDLWTVVQWQDGQGAWHDVAGWRGTLDEITDGLGRKTWWVAAVDLAKGPFRWVVYQNVAGPILFASDPFDLPATPGSRMTVEVMLSR